MVKEVNVVLVKHPGCGVTYIFKVSSIAMLNAGDWVLCETKKNPVEIARCITPSFKIPEPLIQILYNVSPESLKPVTHKLRPSALPYERAV